MNVLRSIGQDLVEKKLWPVAVVLVALLAALPLLLGGGGDDVVVPEESAAVASAPPVGLPGAGQIAVASEPPAAAPRAKSRRDPFRQQFVKKPESEVTAAMGGAKPAAAGDALSAAPAPKAGGDQGAKAPASPAPATTPKAKAPAPKLDPLDVYRVSLRFGRPGAQKTMRDIPRLSPLPNADQPFFVFLGVLSGGKKAVFLVSSDATTTGQGRCLPSKDDCQTLELAPGDTSYLELQSGSGTTTRYRLDLASIRRRSSASSPTSGALTTTRAKKDSGDDVSATLAAGTGYRWDSKAGVLVRRESEAKSRSGEDAASAAQAAAEAEAREAATIALVTWYFAVVASIQDAAAQAVMPAPEAVAPAPEAPAPDAAAPEPAPDPAP